MTGVTLGDLQESVRDRSAFNKLDDYLSVGRAFLDLIREERPTRVVSPSQANYVFYQYDQIYRHKITRPLNTELFFDSTAAFEQAYDRFMAFLGDLRKYRSAASDRAKAGSYIESNEINRVVYTLQQSLGCISDSFDDTNQSRKRAGQLFETLIKLTIQEVGIECQPRRLTFRSRIIRGTRCPTNWIWFSHVTKRFSPPKRSSFTPMRLSALSRRPAKIGSTKSSLTSTCSRSFSDTISQWWRSSFTMSSAPDGATVFLGSIRPSRVITSWAIQ